MLLETFYIDIRANKWYNFAILTHKGGTMSATPDQTLKFTIDFNSVLMNHQMPPEEKIPKLLQLQTRLDELPNEQSKVLFKLQSNLSIGQCYVDAHQKYNLTNVVEECKILLHKLEEYDFAHQPQKVWGYLAERFQSYYGELIDLCQAKNHQRDIAYCHQEVARIWDRAGNESNCVRAFVLSNVALSKVPGKFALTQAQLVEQFPDEMEYIQQIFSTRTLKNDPIEQTEEYIAVYDDAERIIQGLIEQQGRMPRTPDQYWNIKQEVLELHFGITWRSPRVMNPGVRF